MADYGIKILKPNAPAQYDVNNAPARYLIILSTAESHKVSHNGSLSSGVNSVTHSLGFIPFCQGYFEDSNGDLFPLGYIDDQFFDSMYMTITTAALSLQRSGTTRWYTIYFED